MLTYFLVYLGLVQLVCGDCGPPPVIEHSTNNARSGTTFEEGTTVRYRCAYTHVRAGWPVYVCVDGAWSNRRSNLVCHWKTCGHLDIEHGSYTLRSYTVGNMAHFSCNHGYRLQGPRRSICRTDRRWTRVPTCEVVSCHPLPSRNQLRRFQATLGGGLTNIYNSVVRNSCPEGYRLRGSAERRCQADGTWSGHDASCIVSRCSEPDVGDGVVHGLTPDQSGLYRLNSFGLVSCNDGSVLTGSDTIVCETSGWSDGYCQRSCYPETEISHGWFITTSVVSHGEKVRWGCERGYYKDPPQGQALCNNSRFEPQPTCQPVVSDESSCQDIPEAVTSRHGDTCYYYLRSSRSYGSAVSLCQAYNTQPLIVDSHVAMEYISAAVHNFGQGHAYWLGMRYGDRWVWNNNANVAYQHWFPGQGGRTCDWLEIYCHKFQRCAVLKLRGVWGWDDVDCDDAHKVICQKEMY